MDDNYFRFVGEVLRISLQRSRKGVEYLEIAVLGKQPPPDEKRAVSPSQYYGEDAAVLANEIRPGDRVVVEGWQSSAWKERNEFYDPWLRATKITRIDPAE